MSKQPAPTEHKEAVALMQLVRLHENKYPVLRRLFHVPNGGNRNVITAKKLKAEGVRPGVPDYFLPAAMGCYHGLAVELKRTKRGSVSEDQRDWLEYLDDAGWRVVVCAGHERAWAVICEYIGARDCLK